MSRTYDIPYARAMLPKLRRGLLRIEFWTFCDACTGPFAERWWPSAPRSGDDVFLAELDDSRPVERVEWSDAAVTVWLEARHFDREALERAGVHDPAGACGP